MGIRKANPLFVDSTRMNSDRIGMKVELKSILLYEGEKVYFQYTDLENGQYRIEMMAHDEGHYFAQVWLNHQQEINYRFLVKLNEETLAQSAIENIKALYYLEEVWTPICRSKWSNQLQAPNMDDKPLMPGALRKSPWERPSEELSSSAKDNGLIEFEEISKIVKRWGF